jgi:hypothetical protein
MGNIYYKKHWWTHYFSLLISSFPVLILFYTFFVTKLIPRVLSGFGMLAATLLFVEVFLSLFGKGFGMNMMMPIGLTQLIVPFWLLFKGLKTQKEKTLTT